MKTKVIVLALAGLGLSTALMAQGPRGGGASDRSECGEHRMMHHGDQEQRMQRHHAQDSGKHMRRGHRRGWMRQLGRQLHLTDDQRQQLRTLFKEERQARKAQHKARRHSGKKHGGLFGQLNPETFMSADHFDKAAFTQAVEAKASERKSQRQAMRKSRLEHRAAFLEKVFNILTPEQRVKWIELSRKNAQ